MRTTTNKHGVSVFKGKIAIDRVNRQPCSLLPDHPKRAHRPQQGVQVQADPEAPPETRSRMSGPGHLPKGAGDGGGMIT